MKLKYYAINEDTKLIRIFSTKKSRDEWIKKDKSKRRVATETEIYHYLKRWN